MLPLPKIKEHEAEVRESRTGSEGKKELLYVMLI